MESLTGLSGFDWILFFLGALAVLLGVGSRRRAIEGSRVLGLAIIPLLAGVCLAIGVTAAHSDDFRHLLSRLLDRPEAAVVALLALVAALACVDLLFGRVVPGARRAFRLLGLSARSSAEAALLLGLGVPVAVAVGSLPRLSNHLTSGYERAQGTSGGSAIVERSFSLPGHPMDLVFTTSSSGYVSLGEGSIARFELPPSSSGTLGIRTVARGLRYPRGIAVLGDTLFVGELGPLPCQPSFPSCKGGDIEGVSVEATERAILRTSRGRILAFTIRADGALSGRREVIADLPVANSDHGVNDVVAGPDGRIYVSLGNLDRLYATRGLGPDLRRPHADLLGTIISVEPDGSGLDMYASGLRNVYGLAFDAQGRLYGSDNDGLTRRGWKREELLAIRRGGRYGYPEEGTFAPYAIPRDPPLWLLDTVGSGGIAWTANPGPTLFVGSCGSLDSVRLSTSPDGLPRVAGPAEVTRLLDLPGCITAVASRPGGVAIGVFTFTGDPKLSLIRLAS